MEQNFKPGDTVRLKSGGPKMTVSSLKMTKPFKPGDYPKYTGEVFCSWFKENGEKDSGVFYQDSLEPA